MNVSPPALSRLYQNARKYRRHVPTEYVCSNLTVIDKLIYIAFHA